MIDFFKSSQVPDSIGMLCLRSMTFFYQEFLILKCLRMSFWFSIYCKWYEFRARICKVRLRVCLLQVIPCVYFSKSRKSCVSNLPPFQKKLCTKFTDFIMMSKCVKACRFNLLFLALIFWMFTTVRNLKCKESKAILYAFVCPLCKIPK